MVFVVSEFRVSYNKQPHTCIKYTHDVAKILCICKAKKNWNDGIIVFQERLNLEQLEKGKEEGIGLAIE